MWMYILVFLLGIAWDACIAYNTRLIAEAKIRKVAIFISSVGMTVIWGLVIKSISIDALLIIPYAIGGGIGTLIGIKMHGFHKD